MVALGGRGGRATATLTSAIFFSKFFKVVQLQNLRKYPRRPCGSFWYHLELWGPRFDRFRSIFPLFCWSFDPHKYENSTLPLHFFKEHALKPSPDCRSRDSAQIRLIESSPNPNLTDLVKKQCRDFHRFRYNCGLVASTTATATTTIAAAQRRQLGDCGLVATTTATATTTIAAAQRRRRLRRWRW